MIRTLCLMLPAVVLAILLAACTLPQYAPSGVDKARPAAQAAPAASLEQVQAGAAWLDSSLEAFDQVVAAAKERSPDKAAAIDEQIGAMLGNFRAGVGAYKTALASGQAAEADAKWGGLRAKVTAVTRAIGPYAIDALVVP